MKKGNKDFIIVYLFVFLGDTGDTNQKAKKKQCFDFDAEHNKLNNLEYLRAFVSQWFISDLASLIMDYFGFGSFSFVLICKVSHDLFFLFYSKKRRV
jgi:hypothetical protein